MASTTFCDWCGEIMEIPGGREPLHLAAVGNGGDGFMFSPLGNLHFHHDRDASDSCLLQIVRLLKERAEWAHDPDQDAQEWRLVPRADSVPTSPKVKAAEWTELDERHRRWTELAKPRRTEMIRRLLEDEARTAREIAEGLEAAHPELRVAPERIRPIVAALAKSGELHREAETYRSGESIRYRYSLADGEES